MAQIRRIERIITEDPDVLLEKGPSYKRILSVLKHHLIFGGGDRKPTKKENELVDLFNRGVSMEEVIYAMLQDKCIGNVGSTYLKTIIGRGIRELWPMEVNNVRRLIGLKPVKVDVKKAVKKAVRKARTPN